VTQAKRNVHPLIDTIPLCVSIRQRRLRKQAHARALRRGDLDFPKQVKRRLFLRGVPTR